MKKLDSGFEVLRFSDLNYENMTVEIQYNGEQIAQVNSDQGLSKLEIEFFTVFSDKKFNPIFRLEDLLEAIGEAKKILESYS